MEPWVRWRDCPYVGPKSETVPIALSQVQTQSLNGAPSQMESWSLCLSIWLRPDGDSFYLGPLKSGAEMVPMWWPRVLDSIFHNVMVVLNTSWKLTKYCKHKVTGLTCNHITNFLCYISPAGHLSFTGLIGAALTFFCIFQRPEKLCLPVMHKGRIISTADIQGKNISDKWTSRQRGAHYVTVIDEEDLLLVHCILS